MSLQDWDEVMELNLRAVFLCTKAALRPMMKQRWGRIINIGSVSGLAGNAGQANYAAAKSGLVGFTRAVAREMGSRNITANLVTPGLVITELTKDIRPEIVAGVKQRLLDRPHGQAGRRRGVVVYLASEEAGYVTGQVLVGRRRAGALAMAGKRHKGADHRAPGAVRAATRSGTPPADASTTSRRRSALRRRSRRSRTELVEGVLANHERIDEIIRADGAGLPAGPDRRDGPEHPAACDIRNPHR